METFTVIDADGYPVARHLTAAAAAHLILTDDGRGYEIRPMFYGDEEDYNDCAGIVSVLGADCDGGYELWTRQQVANRPWSKTVLFSFADTLADAEAEIFAAVIRANWSRHPQAMTDAEYDAISL